MSHNFKTLDFLKKSIAGNSSPEEQVEFLSKQTIHSPKELAGIVQYLLEHAQGELKIKDAIDFCGTGGSGLPRMNISTPVSFLLASAGIKVVKHGNRASSGRYGSFDLLESLGINFSDDFNRDQDIFDKTGLTFLFAQKCHPSMKHFASARKQLGKSTFFNLLGPLLNPSQPKYQFIGTSFHDSLDLILQTAKLLGRKHVFAVQGSDGLDKATLTGETYVAELKNGKIKHYTIKPEDFGLKRVDFNEISGSPEENPIFIRQFLNGELKGPRFDLICLNASFGFVLSGKATTLVEGFRMAKKAALSPQLTEFFLKYVDLSQIPSVLLKIVSTKEKEVKARKSKEPLLKFKKSLTPSVRDFKKALLSKKITLIAEIKPASPSAGTIDDSKLSVSHRARIYENEGASAISVLTDESYFKASLENLKEAEQGTKNIPLLCKDFIIDPYQIYEARKYGADAILLIAAILSSEKMQHFLDIAQSLNMDALCEVHNLEELKKVLNTNAEIIGINNRNLHDFSIDLNTTRELIPRIPKGKIIVSESGLENFSDLEKLERVNSVLIGTAIMRAKSVPKKIHELLNIKPRIKICGVQSAKEMKLCEQTGVSYLGFNFVPTSRRYLDPIRAKKILSIKNNSIRIGIFKNQKLKEVNAIAKEFDLDYIQLSGEENIHFVQACNRPVIKGFSIRSKKDLESAKKMAPHVAYILFDGIDPGAGKEWDHRLLKGFEYPFILAGGISVENVNEKLSESQAYFVDVASGVEENGKRSLKKITELSKILNVST